MSTAADRSPLKLARREYAFEELVPLGRGRQRRNSYVAQHAEAVNAPLVETYKELPELILTRFGEVSDPTEELIKRSGGE